MVNKLSHFFKKMKQKLGKKSSAKYAEIGDDNNQFTFTGDNCGSRFATSVDPFGTPGYQTNRSHY